MPESSIAIVAVIWAIRDRRKSVINIKFVLWNIIDCGKIAKGMNET